MITVISKIAVVAAQLREFVTAHADAARTASVPALANSGGSGPSIIDGRDVSDVDGNNVSTTISITNVEVSVWIAGFAVACMAGFTTNVLSGWFRNLLANRG